MEIFRSIRFYIRVAAFLLNTVCCWAGLELACLLCCGRKRIELINTWLPRWSRINLWVFGVEVDVSGPYGGEGGLYPALGPHGVGRVFVANHRSALDIPIIFTVAEAHCISRHDLANWPLIGPGARRVGTLFVDRSSRRSGASVLRQVDQALEKGEGVAMFPEGTAHEGDEVFEFRPGAFNAARRAGSEIVPLGISYGHEDAYYRRPSFMAHIRQFAKLKRLRVAVEIGTPLKPNDYPNSEMKVVARERVQELVNRARARLEGMVGSDR